MNSTELVRGGRYNWKNQKERLIYMGKKHYTFIGVYWYQFALVEEPHKVWCEVLERDLESFEKTIS